MCVCFDELPVKMCSLVGGWDGCIIFAGMCNNINRKSFGVLYLLSYLHTKKTTSDFDHEIMMRKGTSSKQELQGACNPARGRVKPN